MNPPDPQTHLPDSAPDDESFVQLLRESELHPPPASWRSEILAAAANSAGTQSPSKSPDRRRWAQSWIMRGLAASWIVSLLLYADTRRRESHFPPPATTTLSPVNPSSQPTTAEEMEALLATLDHPPLQP